MSQAGFFLNGVLPPGTAVQSLTGNDNVTVFPNAANNIYVVGYGVVYVTGNNATSTETISLNSASIASTNSAGGKSSQLLVTGTNDTSWGANSLAAVTSGNQNTAIGSGSLSAITTGSGNIALGYNSGSSYTSSESNNISIGATGTAAESGVTRIGTHGTQTKVIIPGIDTVNVGSVATVVTESSDQLGTAVITAGTNISITPTANVITIATTGNASFFWQIITVNQTASSNMGYISNKAGTLALLLPATSSVGDIVRIIGMNAGNGWQVTQGAGQQIFFGTSSTTSGAGGSLASTATNDALEMVCNVANTTWLVLSAIGNITVT